MWVGACTSSIGTWMQIVAQGWLIYRLSHSAFLLALDQFLGGIPIFLFSLIGGVVADRIERRKILLASQYVQMASATLLTVLVTTGLVHVWQILCLSCVSGLAQAFGAPAYQALIPTLVKREDMPNAIALNSIQFNLAVTVGPALAGLVLASFGEKWCFGLNALSFVAVIVSLLSLNINFKPARTGESICIEVAGRLRRSRVTERGRELHLFRPGGHVVLIQALTEDALGVAAPAAEGSLRTPLPGTVVAVHVRVGQQVAEGAPLVTVEAMKMEHTLTAPRGGVVARVVHAPGERVAAGDFLIELSG